jgi:hypothetical protein
MSQDEVSSLLQASMDKDKAEWEKARIQAFYTVVSMNGTKQYKKPSDLFKFPWESKPVVKKVAKVLSKEEFEKIANKAITIQHGKERSGSRG